MLTALRSALLSGEPCKKSLIDNIVVHVWCRTYMQNGDLGQVLQRLPLPPDVVHLAHDDHVFDLVEVEVGSSEGHHQVPQTDQGAVRVCEHTNNHVPIQNRHRWLVSVLKGNN